MVSTPVPIIDLGKEFEVIRSEAEPAILRVLSSGTYVLGSETSAFERELATYCGVSRAVGVNSGTDAILFALKALGIGVGDEVILPAMTFIATAEPVVQLGARPVFVDIDPVSYTLDLTSVEKQIRKQTKAIIAVHLYGQMPDMDRLVALANSAKIPLIEDMAQAIGSEWKGRRAGSWGQLACVSFFPTKNLGACGDGGAVLANDGNLALRIERMRNHGAAIKYQHEEIGYTSRLDEIQAALLRIKLRHLPEWTDTRRRWAHRYSETLRDQPVTLPSEWPQSKHSFHLYSLRSSKRDALRQALSDKGIATGLHYPAPLHLQRSLAYLGHRKGDFPESERLSAETLSLPLHPHLTTAESEAVCDAVKQFFLKAH